MELMASLIFITLAQLELKPIEQIIKEYNILMRTDPAANKRILSQADKRIVLMPGSDVIIVNKTPYRLQNPVMINNGSIQIDDELDFIIESTFQKLKSVLVVPRKTQKIKKSFKVVIDPGHGGNHKGTKGISGQLEKNVNLDIAMMIRDLLVQHGFDVTLTRNQDTHLSSNLASDLEARVEITNKIKPDLFISVHSNWHKDPTIKGFEIYVPRSGEFKQASINCGRILQQYFSENLDTPNRGIKEAGFHVIKYAKCPAVLVEVDFLSNPTADRELSHTTFRQRVASLIASSIIAYLQD